MDALPDLSDVQVIIRTPYPGQAPQIVENQVTYPMTTTMLSVPGAKTVRGFSFFGDSYVYVLFDDKTGALVGAHMIGAEVTEMIQGYVTAITMEATEEDVFGTVYPHPTMSEAMHEAALDAYGRVIHI